MGEADSKMDEDGVGLGEGCPWNGVWIKDKCAETVKGAGVELGRPGIRAPSKAEEETGPHLARALEPCLRSLALPPQQWGPGWLNTGLGSSEAREQIEYWRQMEWKPTNNLLPQLRWKENRFWARRWRREGKGAVP